MSKRRLLHLGALALLLAGPAAPVSAQLIRREVAPTPLNLADWAGPKRFSPALAAAGLTIYYCAAHFPAGSQALANLEAAVAAYDAMPGVALDLTLAPRPGAHVPELWLNDAIMVDYAALPDEGWAAGPLDGCRPIGAADATEECTRGRIKLSEAHYVTDTDPWDAGRAPSVGVFFHELGHLFGMTHPQNSAGANLHLARATIHGPKHHSDDPRGTARHAATLAHLRAAYPVRWPTLPTTELTAHPVLMLGDPVTGASDEITLDRRFQRHPESGLADDLNHVRLRWNSAAQRFDVCTAGGGLPSWRAQLSDTGGGTAAQSVTLRWSIANATPRPTAWTTLATTTIDPASGAEPLAQYDWTTTLRITATAAGLPYGGPTAMTRRELAFEIDPENAVVESDETDNRVTASVCLYPAGDACDAPCD